MTPFHAMIHDRLLVEALLPKTHQKVKSKVPLTISRHTGKMAENERTLEDVKSRCRKFDTDSAPVRQNQVDPIDANYDRDNQNLSGVERLKKRKRMTAVNVRPDLATAASKTDLEIEKYLRNADTDVDFSDPLQWFFRNKETYPILTELAAERHSIPASSSSSERAFSMATRVSKDV